MDKIKWCCRQKKGIKLISPNENVADDYMENSDMDFDERFIYSDKKLVQGVKQSMMEAKSGKGKIVKSDKEVDEYFEAL